MVHLSSHILEDGKLLFQLGNLLWDGQQPQWMILKVSAMAKGESQHYLEKGRCLKSLRLWVSDGNSSSTYRSAKVEILNVWTSTMRAKNELAQYSTLHPPYLTGLYDPQNFSFFSGLQCSFTF